MKRQNVLAITAIAVATALVAGIGVFAINPIATTKAYTNPGESSLIQYQEGLIASAHDELPGHYNQQIAMILPEREDAQQYSGVLTFTASKKVEVEVLQKLTQNMSLIDHRFGRVMASTLPTENKTNVAIVLIGPDYTNIPIPIPSASIPFTGNALLLHSLSGEPFVASYSVSYTLGHPRFVNSWQPFPSDVSPTRNFTQIATRTSNSTTNMTSNQ